MSAQLLSVPSLLRPSDILQRKSFTLDSKQEVDLFFKNHYSPKINGLNASIYCK